MDSNVFQMNKIINDPVHGFIKVEGDLLSMLIDHPWMQRLRRIRQLGMTNLVYPGAQHTRFQHAIGALHLMNMALDTLAAKGTKIKPDERTAAQTAIMLHDIGHGPFSHALENHIVFADHEDVTRVIMQKFESRFGDSISDTIRAFRGECRPFIHQLISSQLDTDRLDYLKRDSFFSGVVEGTVGSDRLIKMLDVTPQGQLAVEVKGVFTIEDFLIARRMMYWQVYLHRTVVSAERMLRTAVERARQLTLAGVGLNTSPTLDYFLRNEITLEHLELDDVSLNRFCELDDDDVSISLKIWARSSDPVLSYLSRSIVNRCIFNIEMSMEPVAEQRIAEEQEKVAKELNLSLEDAKTLVMTGAVSSKTYSIGIDRINLLMRDRSVKDISDVSDIIKTGAVGGADKRYYICFPRENNLLL